MTRKTNIYETLYLLKNAEVFIGTSLHGIVVSTSYGIPHMVLTNRINKLLNYVETWKTTSVKYTDADEIYNNFCKIYSNNEKKNLLVIKNKLIKLALDNFDNINKIINEVYDNYEQRKRIF